MRCGYIGAKGAGEMTFIVCTMNVCECTKILSDTMTPNLQKPAEEGYSSIIMIQGTLPTSQ